MNMLNTRNRNTVITTQVVGNSNLTVPILQQLQPRKQQIPVIVKRPLAVDPKSTATYAIRCSSAENQSSICRYQRTYTHSSKKYISRRRDNKQRSQRMKKK